MSLVPAKGMRLWGVVRDGRHTRLYRSRGAAENAAKEGPCLPWSVVEYLLVDTTNMCCPGYQCPQCLSHGSVQCLVCGKGMEA